MEDVSEGTPYQDGVGRNGDTMSDSVPKKSTEGQGEPTFHHSSSRLSLKKSTSQIGDSSTKSSSKRTDDVEVYDLTQDSPIASPVTTRSTSSQSKSPQESPQSSSRRRTSQKDNIRRTQPSSVSPNEELNGNVQIGGDVLNDSVDDINKDDEEDESDTSWIIPSTPPVKSTRQSVFAPPRGLAPQSRLSDSGSSSSKMMASTPLDTRSRMSTLVGNTFLPKISPVKVVLEKMVFDASNLPVIQDKNIEEFTTGEDQSAHSPNLKKLTTQQNDVNRPLTRQRSSSEQSTDTVSSSGRSTRSSSQSPVASKQSTRRNKMTKDTPGKPSKFTTPKRSKRNGTVTCTKNKAGVGRNKTSTKVSQLSPAPAKDKSEGTSPVRRTRRNSHQIDSEHDAVNDQGMLPSGTPDAPEVVTPVVVSDDSLSPTPSPTFGSSSSTTPETSPGKPSKRKRKQSMPMRSPDRLQLTSGDAAVKVTPQGGNLKVHTKVKQKSKLPYKSPSVRKSRSKYHPLKKKYKSFSLVEHTQPVVKTQTRSVTRGSVREKGTSGDGNTTRSDERSIERTSDANKDEVIRDGKSNGATDDVCHEDESIQDGKSNGATDAGCQGDGDTKDNNDDEDVSIIASSSTENVENQTIINGSPDGEAMFAFDYEDGGFDGEFHDISHHDGQQNEKENNPHNSTAKVHFSLCGDLMLTKDSEEHMHSMPTPNVKSPHKNDSPGMSNNHLVETSKILSSSINGTNCNGASRVRLPQEIYIPKGNKDPSKDFSVSPRKSVINNSIPSTPVITEKVVVVQNYAPLYFGSHDNGEVISLTDASVVPSHRQATASPTLIDHPLSPSSTIGSPIQTNETAGYFGVGSESFLQFQQEEVIETSPTREAFGVVNEEAEDDDGAFVPPGKKNMHQYSLINDTVPFYTFDYKDTVA